MKNILKTNYLSLLLVIDVQKNFINKNTRNIPSRIENLIQNNKFPLKVNLDNFISAARGYLNFPATHLAAGIR